MTYQLTILPSRLRVATEYMSGVESAAITVSVGVGSRYETLDENGLSHVLEHMAFKGTKTRSAKQIAEAFEDIGGQFNAYTSVEQTVYYARVLSEYLPRAMELLGDILLNSTLSTEELEREKLVITQEIAMHADTPEDYITDIFDALAYPEQPLGRSILGTETKIKRLTRDDVVGYMQKHYHPSRMVISVAGNCAHAEVLNLTERYFSMPISTNNPRAIAPAHYRGGTSHLREDFEQTHILLGYAGVPLGHKDFYVLQLLSVILGGGMSSRLFQEIRENRGLAYQVSSYVSAYSDTGMLLMSAASAPKDAVEIPKLMTHELEQLSQHISEEELLRAKNQQITELALARENSSAVAGWIGRHLLTYNEYITFEQLKTRIHVVTTEQIKTLAQVILATDTTLATLGN